VSRRRRRARAHAFKVARASLLMVDVVCAYARFDIMRAIELQRERDLALKAIGNGRKAPRRRRRARVAKRIAARYGDQHYASAKSRHRR
jgi:hypothetical protein